MTTTTASFATAANDDAASGTQQRQQQQQQQQQEQPQRHRHAGVDPKDRVPQHAAGGVINGKLSALQQLAMGDTAGNMIEVDTDPLALEKTMVQGYNSNVFKISGICVYGSVIALPHIIMKYAPRTVEEITVESLRFLDYLVPRHELLLIGTGTTNVGQFDDRIDESVFQWLDDNDYRWEVMDSVTAFGTFNVMNEEDRLVAALILPVYEDDSEWPDDEITVSNHTT
jgi:uncharacterized protein